MTLLKRLLPANKVNTNKLRNALKRYAPVNSNKYNTVRYSNLKNTQVRFWNITNRNYILTFIFTGFFLVTSDCLNTTPSREPRCDTEWYRSTLLKNNTQSRYTVTRTRVDSRTETRLYKTPLSWRPYPGPESTSFRSRGSRVTYSTRKNKMNTTFYFF